MAGAGSEALALAGAFLFGILNLIPGFPWEALAMAGVLPPALVPAGPLQAAAWLGIGLAALLYALPLALGAVAAPIQAVRRRPARLAGVLGAWLLALAVQAGVLMAFLHVPALHGLQGAVMAASVALACGLLLAVADRATMTVVRAEHLGLGAIVLVAVLQAGNALPGASPFLLALLALRLLAVERPDALRLALLVAAPVWLAIGLLHGRHHGLPDLRFALALLAAALGAALTIVLLAAWLRRRGLAPFAGLQVLAAGGALLGALAL